MIDNDTSERYSSICLYCECELNHSKENKANKNHLRKYCSENHKALYKKEIISKIAYTERKLKAEKEKSLFKPTLLPELPILSDELMNEFMGMLVSSNLNIVEYKCLSAVVRVNITLVVI